MPRVSVVIPCYNHERFVRQAVESVLAQTFEDLEVCITDDGSTDGTADVVASIRDKRIRFKRFERNRGVSAALNDAIRRSSGEFIAELNSDDYFLADKTAIQVEFLESHPEVGAVFGCPAFVAENGQAIAEEETFYRGMFKVENHSRAGWLKRLFPEGNCLCHPTHMIRRGCHDEAGLYDERLAQLHDLDLWLRVLRRHAIHVLPEMLVMFRIMAAEGNASAPNVAVISRTIWESERVLRRYLELDESLFREVFEEEMKALGVDPGLPRSIKYGRIAVATQFQPAQRLGLELLYNAVPAVNGEEPVQASAREVIELSGRLDLNYAGRTSAMYQEVETLKRTIADLEARLLRRDKPPGAETAKKLDWLPWLRKD